MARIPKKEKEYRLGLKLQGDYKGKSISGKVKELVKTAIKQHVGTAKDIVSVIKKIKKKNKNYSNQ